jgi:hypothetical protein
MSSATKYLFIDGGCLRKLLEGFATKYGITSQDFFDFEKLQRVGEHQKVFYYDCPPAKQKDEDQSQ